MRKLLLIALMLTTGLLVGCGQKEETGAAVEKVKKVKWKMASTFPGSLVQIGTLGVRLQNEVSKISGGNVTIKFFEPGALVPALEIFDAVSTGGVDAGWGTRVTGQVKFQLYNFFLPYHLAHHLMNICHGCFLVEAKSSMKSFTQDII